MENTLSLIDVDIALEAARAALGTGGFYADVVCQRRAATTVRFEDGRVDDVSTGIDSGAGVRVIKGSLAAYAHTDVIDRDHLLRAAHAAADALRHAAEGPVLLAVEPDRPVPSVVCDVDAAGYDMADIVHRLELCDAAARSFGPEVRQVTALHTSLVEDELLADSLGETGERDCRRTRLVVQVVAGRNGVMQVGIEAPGELLGPAFYGRHDPADVARKAAKRAIVMLDARPSPTGPMAVVVHSGTGGTMLHEACGHGLEADHLQRGASVYAGRVGETVASPLVSALDNPTLPGLWGSYERDDEGTPSQATVLIEDGVLRGFLYARHEAMKDGVTSTGNGRRQSFRNLPIPRMSNTYIAPGSSQATEIISSTPRGLFAAKLGGGQVDPATGDYIFAVSEGYMIEDGKLTYPVRGATLVGNGPRTLELIDAVGNDLAHEEGTCGKDGQGAPVTTGGPTFRISELTVGGTEV